MNNHARGFFNSQKQKCNVCGCTPWFWLPRGHRNNTIYELEIIGAGRRYSDCPRCKSSDRDRLLYHYLTRVTTPDKNSKILHVAPEKPLWKRWSNFSVDATGVDARTKGYRFAYDKSVENHSIESLPYNSESFDWVIANHVLEHVKDESKALKEIHRVLRTGGHLIAQVPISRRLKSTRFTEKTLSKEERINQYGQFDHLRLHGEDYPHIVSKCGFQFEPYQMRENEANGYRVNPEEALFHFYRM